MNNHPPSVINRKHRHRKNILLSSFVFLFILGLIFISIMVLYFSFAPQMGGSQTETSIKKLSLSPNYKEGHFHNLVPTHLASLKELPSIAWTYLTSQQAIYPNHTIKTLPFSKQSFEEAPKNEVYVSWLGHSSALIKLDGHTIIIDPVFSDRASMFSFVGPKAFSYSNPIILDSLPTIDAIIISHDHYDHLDYKTITYLKDRDIMFFVPLGVSAHLEAWGVPTKNIVSLDWWKGASFKSIELVFVPSRHFSGRKLVDQFETLWGGWVIKSTSASIFFSGDSGYFPGFKEIGRRYGPFDITFIECGQYNEKWRNIHMLPEETIQTHLDVKGKALVPIHWGKYALALHEWKEPIERAVQEAERRNISILTPEIGLIFRLFKDTPKNRWWEILKSLPAKLIEKERDSLNEIP